MKRCWKTIADNLKKAGRSLGWVSAVDSEGQTISIADAKHDGKRIVVRADEKLTAFLELERRFVCEATPCVRFRRCLTWQARVRRLV